MRCYARALPLLHSLYDGGSYPAFSEDPFMINLLAASNSPSHWDTSTFAGCRECTNLIIARRKSCYRLDSMHFCCSFMFGFMALM